MEQDKAFLGKEPIGKLLLKLALPTVAAQMINMLYNLVDRIYIGHIPNVGVSALAGVGVCMRPSSAMAGLRGCRFIWERKTMKQPKRYWETVLQCR